MPIWEIMLYNGLTEDSVIQPGDELIIRLAEGAEPPPTPTPPVHHIVRAGTTPGALPPGIISVWRISSGITAWRKMRCCNRR
ncbi:MAG: hypothetical protein M5U34_11870 [Chloroflexi bacterium]|nr:hypothetical protein [Chloroflexota bacterium]